MRSVREANGLCEMTANKLIFSIQPSEDTGSSSLGVGVRVTDLTSTKTDLLSVDAFLRKVAAEQAWLDDNFDQVPFFFTERRFEFR